MARRPPVLQRGDTIGLVTAGSPLDANIINTRAQTIRDMGFNIAFGRNVYSFEGIVASSAEKRAEDVMEHVH